jgi:hypothetical protein
MIPSLGAMESVFLQIFILKNQIETIIITNNCQGLPAFKKDKLKI